MPCASAPKAPWVEVWAVAADDRHAGEGEALFRSDDMDDALTAILLRIVLDPKIGGVAGKRLDLDAALLVLDAERAVGRVGTLWSTTASVRSRVTHTAAGHAQALEGCGLVTSCTRWRSM